MTCLNEIPWIPTQFWIENVVHILKVAFLSLPSEGCFRSSSRSVKMVRDWLQKCRVNTEGFVLLVREQVKNGNIATSRRVRRFRSKISSPSYLSSRMKVNHALKAKMEAFRNKKSPESGN